MTSVKRAPHLWALAKRVHTAFKRSQQKPHITEAWLLFQYRNPSLTDDALEQLYLELLKQFGGEPPPQNERRREWDAR